MKPESDVLRLLRVAALLWIGYFLALAAIDHWLLQRQSYAPWYYGINVIIALLVLALALWTWGQQKLGRALLPLAIVMMSVVPVLGNYRTAYIFPGLFPHGPPISPEGMAQRLLPVLLIALVFTAWQYRWRHVVLLSFGTAGLNLAMVVLSMDPKAPPPLLGGFVVTLIQTIIFLIVGYFISLLMERLRAQHASLQEAHAQLAHYASALESLTISRERNRMARELHDTLAHTLSGLSVQLETAKAYWSVDPEAARAMLDRSLTEARSGLQETRRALKALRASPLDDLGLSLALRRLAESTQERANLVVDLTLPTPMPSLSPDVEQCLYRVAQEAIANTVYHANARHLELQLAGDEEKMALVIRDDGQGFDVAAAEQGGHYGLAGMRERAALVGGTLVVASKIGQGTTVRLTV
jgi:signal transduction histidine kinase